SAAGSGTQATCPMPECSGERKPRARRGKKGGHPRLALFSTFIQKCAGVLPHPRARYSIGSSDVAVGTQARRGRAARWQPYGIPSAATFHRGFPVREFPCENRFTCELRRNF